MAAMLPGHIVGLRDLEHVLLVERCGLRRIHQVQCRVVTQSRCIAADALCIISQGRGREDIELIGVVSV